MIIKLFCNLGGSNNNNTIKMAEEVKRLYSGLTDELMIEGAQTMVDLYREDVADFTAFDASLTTGYADGVQDLIDAAVDIPSDETVQNEISELTDAVQTAWDACKTHFQDAKYFIEKAFPGNVARHKVFGFNDYEKMSRTQSTVKFFMDQFSDTAVKYQTELIAAGYTAPKIAAIATLDTAFDTANRAQEKAKKDRLEATQNRNTAMNDVWRAIKIINQASKSVYRTNYAKLQQYLMPAPASNEPAEALSLRGTVINTITNLPEAGVAVALPDLGLATVTDLTGSYAFAAGAPAGDTALTGVKTGFANYEATVTLVDDVTVTKNFQITPE